MKYIYKTIKTLICCTVLSAAHGQTNLVLNPSFEEVNEGSLSCNLYIPLQFNDAISFWTVPNLGTSDIYHMSLDINCSTHPLSTGNGFISGHQLPRTGDSMVGMVTFSTVAGDPYREYIQGELSEPLKTGKNYTIEFYVSLADNSELAANNFGIKFFTETYFQYSYEYIDVIPDANYTDVITDTENWTLIKLEFAPQVSGLTHFIIGSFFNNEETIIEQVYPNTTDPFDHDLAYYYIDDVSIFIDTTPVFKQTESYCQGTLFELPMVSENGYSGTWSPEINNQETTTYTFTPDDPEIDQTTMTVEIIEPYIEPEFNIETTICEGVSFMLPEVSENGYSGVWSPQINNGETTTYTFTPEDGHCALSTSITIEVTKRTDPEFTIKPFICAGTDFTLPKIADNGISGMWSPAIDNTQTTTYTFTPENEYCANPVSATVEVMLPEDIIFDTYCFQGDFYIEAILSDISPKHTFQWTINHALVGEESHLFNISKNINLFNERNNVIELTVTDENGCLSVKVIEIENIKNLCFIPKGISPNGDGLNDYFDLENFGGISLQIFNRYGTKVYEKNNYTNQWNGVSNAGEKLPSGTYFYYIVTPKGERVTGWIQLMHES